MPQFHFPGTNIVPAHSAELYDDTGKWTGDIILVDDDKYRLEIPPLLEPTPDYSAETYRARINDFVSSAVSESYKVLESFGLSREAVDSEIDRFGSIDLELTEPYELPAGVYAATRVLEQVLEFGLSFDTDRISLAEAHALTQFSQFASGSTEQLRKILDSQSQSARGSSGGSAPKRCNRLLAIAKRCTASIGVEGRIGDMLTWLESEIESEHLDHIANGYEDFEIERAVDPYKSKITWSADENMNPPEKLVRDRIGSTCFCEIDAKQFLYNYVRRPHV